MKCRGFRTPLPMFLTLLLWFSPCLAPHPAPPALSQWCHVRSQPHWYSLPFPSCSAVNLQTSQETCLALHSAPGPTHVSSEARAFLFGSQQLPNIQICFLIHLLWHSVTAHTDQSNHSHSGAWSLCSLFAKGTSSLLHLMPSHPHRVPRMWVKTTPFI